MQFIMCIISNVNVIQATINVAIQIPFMVALLYYIIHVEKRRRSARLPTENRELQYLFEEVHEEIRRRNAVVAADQRSRKTRVVQYLIE